MFTFANALFLLNIPWKHSTTHKKLLFIKISLNTAQVLVVGNRKITRNMLCLQAHRTLSHILHYSSMHFIFSVKWVILLYTFLVQSVRKLLYYVLLRLLRFIFLKRSFYRSTHLSVCQTNKYLEITGDETNFTLHCLYENVLLLGMFHLVVCICYYEPNRLLLFFRIFWSLLQKGLLYLLYKKFCRLE